MPIFRYTFKKILVSPSTWVVFALTLIILGLGWVLVPSLASSAFPGGKIPWTPEIVKSRLFLGVWKQIAFFGLIGLMFFIFLGIKSVQIFRDEIDDGTLLILVSKPVSRNRIWFEKWLTFQVTNIGYIFLSIFLPSLLLLIPSIAGPKYFIILFPYMWILFGIALLFDLIFSSIVLLISLVLNSKATIALMVGFAALVNVFASAIDPIIQIPPDYFLASQAVKTYQFMEKSNFVDQSDIKWFNDEKQAYLSGVAQQKAYEKSIRDLMAKVYIELIKGVTYPINYDAAQEKVELKEVVDHKAGSAFNENEIVLAKHIYDISSAYRQWDAQSFEELMTGINVGSQNSGSSSGAGGNTVFYSVSDTFKGLAPIDQATLNNINSKISQKKVMRYLNIFYQLSYLFNGIMNQQLSLFSYSPDYAQNDDPYLIKFTETSPGSGDYVPDTSASSNSKIINLTALITMYTLLGISLLGTSWYIFNRRDFA